MPPSRLPFGLLAVAVLVSSCTGSGAAPHSAAESGTGAASGPGATPSGGSVTTSGRTSPSTVGTSAGSVSPTPVRTSIRQGLHATYTVRVWAQDVGGDCRARSYGANVPAYLQAHACRRVDRYLATTTANGRVVGISGATVTFGGGVSVAGRSAAGFAALLFDPAKGGIDDLFRDGKRVPGGPAELPAKFAANARNDGATVAVVDAWYLSGATRSDDPALTELLEAVT